MNPVGFTDPMPEADSPNKPESAALDAAVAARLERLAARRTPSAAAASAPRAKTPAYASSMKGPANGRRRHAAKGARQAALALSLATTGGLSYAMSLSPTADAGAAVAPAGIVSVPSSGATGTASGSPSTTTEPAVDPTPIVVNGDSYTNRFGTVQVQVSFATDGTITEVSTLQTPDGDRKSVSINDRAVPTLNAEALVAQSADVDTVSGATYTSLDYQRSLQSAIDTARASGLIAAA